MRDYDKEPIVIKDENVLFSAIPAYASIIILIFIYIFNPNDVRHTKFIQLFIITPTLMMFPYIIPYKKARNKRFIVLEKENIKFKHENIIIEEINLKQDFQVHKTFDVYYHKSQLPVYIVQNLWWLFMPLYIVFGYIPLIIMKFIYHIIKDGLESYRFFDAIIILQDDKVVNILPNSNKEFEVVKSYFLHNLNIDIEKAPKFINKYGNMFENIKSLGDKNE